MFMVPASYIIRYLLVSFSPSVLILSWFSSSIASVIWRFPLFIISMAHFSMANSIPISWLYILTAYIGVFNSFSFLENSFISSIYIRLSICSCDLWSLYSLVHFLSMWLSGIIAFTNSNGDNASSRKIPLWIFTSVKLFPPTVSSILQFCMVFSINFITSPDILSNLRQSIIQLCGTISYAFL